MQIFIITFLSIKSLQNWAKTKPLHSIVPKFTRKSSPKNIRKFFSWSYFERIFNINGIRHVISTILHRKNVNFVIFFLYCVVTLIFVNKKISSPETGSVLCFCLLQSDQLQWWLYLLFVLILIILLFMYFFCIYVDTIAYWEQTYLYYPIFQSSSIVYVKSS